MSTVKRRKVNTTPGSSAPVTRGLAGWTRTTKSQVLSKEVIDKNIAAATSSPIPVGGKRKLTSVVEVSEIEVDVDGTIAEATAILAAAAETPLPASQEEETRPQRAIRPLPRRSGTSLQHLLQYPPKTPARQLQAAASPIHTPGSVQTPTNGLGGLLDNFGFHSSPKNGTPIQCDTTQGINTDHFPVELDDLVNLFSSFLTALTLHYAHTGTHVPCDIRQLCPNIARCWGKRAVVPTDIKRILGILNYHGPKSAKEDKEDKKPLAKLSLSDYGHGKTCIEIRTVGRIGRMAKPLDENGMNELFLGNLSHLWADADTINVAEFIKAIPMEEVRLCASVTGMSPLLAKGQRRLEDLRFGIVVKKREDEEKARIKEEEKSGPDGMAIDGQTPVKKLSLLERLRMKAQDQKFAPPPPSKEELARKAALGRLEEVVAVLTLFSTAKSAGQSRISFTLPTVIGKLMDSFKTPIAKSEAEACVRLLATDIAPEWCRLMKKGRGEAIVVSTELRPTDEVFAHRIRQAISTPYTPSTPSVPSSSSSPIKTESSPLKMEMTSSPLKMESSPIKQEDNEDVFL